MQITEQSLSEFRAWMVERGRDRATAQTYVCNLRSCAADRDGLLHRLVAGELAPNSLRTNLAALRAWAKFTNNPSLTTRLSDLRLPPARRVHTKIPLDTQDLRRVIHHVAGKKFRREAMRHVILIMAMRGMRSGDVLRIKRTEVLRAISTGKLLYEGKGRKRLEFSAEPIREQLEALGKIAGWERVRDLVTRSSDPKAASLAVWRAARSAAAEIGITEMNPHRFRHTFATRYLERLQGDPAAIIKLQKYMGWASPNTAMRYVDAVSQDELDAIGAELVRGLR